MEFKIMNVRQYDLEESIIASGYPMRVKEMMDYSGDVKVSIDRENGEIWFTDTDTGEKVNWKTVKKLAQADNGSGHDSFLKGILVSFDVQYPVYWSPQAQRYHHLEIISSSSAMHRLTKFNLDESFNKYVDPSVIIIMKKLILAYNELINKEKELKIKWSESGEWVNPIVVVRELNYLNGVTDYQVLPADEAKLEISGVEKTIGVTNIKLWNKKEFYQKLIATCPQGLMKTMRISTNLLQLKTMHSQRRHHKLEEWQVFCDWIESLEAWKLLMVD